MSDDSKTKSSSQVVDLFRQAMEQEGIVTQSVIVADGRIHRFHVEEDKPGTRNGWYTLHADRVAAGAFGSWRLGVRKAWRSDRMHYAVVEARGVAQEQVSDAEKRRHQDESWLDERARSKAEKIWARGKPAPADHAYLVEKQIKPHELRASCGRLLVPLYDADGVLRSLQFIAHDGTKRFLAGGRVQGRFYLLGRPNGKQFVAEGYATAATIREATGEAVAVAFNAGNLTDTAKTLRQTSGHLPIVIAADDDHATPGNPGMTKAFEAARAVGAKIAVPHFHDGHSRGTDFNDLASREGLEEANRQLSCAKEPSEAALSYAEAVIEALSPKPSLREIEKVVAVIATLEGLDRQKFLTTSLSKKVGRQMTKGDLWAAVRGRAAEFDQRRAAAIEAARLAGLRSLKIDPAQLVAELETFFNMRMHLRRGAGLLLALYALNTWCFDLFETVPYLLLTSPLPQCGKTRLMSLLEAVCARARSWVSVSGASMFRTVELCKPTLLIDQVEKLAAVDESSRDLIAILDAGYKKGARVPRMTGKNHDILLEFSVYCPKVLACVGKLKGALLDRCIVNELERKPRGVKLESARTKAIWNKAAKLREACEAYAVQWRQELIRLYEEEPDEGYWPALADREQELCGPLLLHARVAGIEDQALKVARAFSCRKLDIQSQELDFCFARELCEALKELTGERFSSKALLPQLQKTESWGNRLAHAKNDHAASTSIGTFLARFNLDSRKHDASGTTYERAEAITKISSYILQDLGVTGVKSRGTQSESGGCATDTSREGCAADDTGVSPQAAETDRLDSRLIPLTPETEESADGRKSEADTPTAQATGTKQVGCSETPAAQENNGNDRNSQPPAAGVIDGVLKF